MELKELNKIKEIIEVFEQSKVAYIDLEVEGIKIKLAKEGFSISSSEQSSHSNNEVKKVEKNETKAKATESSSECILSPLVGTFHEASYPGATPFVTSGTRVKKGDKLCIIEAMKVMNEIKATKDCVIKKVLVKENQLVGYNQKLFEIGE